MWYTVVLFSLLYLATTANGHSLISAVYLATTATGHYLIASGIITKIACEGKRLSIECPDKKINIVSAIYGRESNSICPNIAVYTTNCKSQSSSSTVSAECNGKSRCTIQSSNKIFGDPCVHTYKYLEVRYTCDETQNFIGLEQTVNEVTICEHETATIECPQNSNIKFMEGSYGRTSSNICPYSGKHQNLHCQINIGPIVEKCLNKTKCVISASNSIFGDPCIWTEKYLSLTYTCQENENRNFKAIACERETISLQCEENQSLVIGQSNYGRLSPNVCAPKSKEILRACVTPYTKDVISSRCYGKNSCAIPATNKLFGDPCAFVEKYLELEYTCISNFETNINIERAEESKRLTLSCPTTIKVHYANYGRTSKEIFNSLSYINDVNCHAASTFSIVESLCSGKRECTLHASNGVFGDPCPHIYKYLEVGYSCANFPIDLRFKESDIVEPN